MSVLFALRDVDVSLNSTSILKGISFDIHAGELLGIIGPNGSGKSTLLRTMAGVLRPSSGGVQLDGREVARMPGRDLARRLAVVPQDTTIAFDYTVAEVVLMGRSPFKGRFQLETEADLKIAAEALRRAGLLHLADRKATVLSGGERQRVMIARALAQGSDILFFDEPTAHLDLKYQVETLQLVRREVAENAKTAVVVLHDLNLAAEFCDRLVLLRAGELHAVGSPEEVITSEIVHRVYGAAVWVKRHPTSGRPYVLSLGSRGIAAQLNRGTAGGGSARVHVICGGGSGGPVFARLVDAGYEVTAGVINIGDTDQESAETLGIEYVEDAPFSPISETAEIANREFIDRADAVILTDVPFGAGNLANLRCAAYAVDRGKRVAVVGDPERFTERDFMDGEVTRMLTAIMKSGASVLASPDPVCGWVAEIRAV